MYICIDWLMCVCVYIIRCVVVFLPFCLQIFLFFVYQYVATFFFLWCILVEIFAQYRKWASASNCCRNFFKNKIRFSYWSSLAMTGSYCIFCVFQINNDEVDHEHLQRHEFHAFKYLFECSIFVWFFSYFCCVCFVFIQAAFSLFILIYAFTFSNERWINRRQWRVIGTLDKCSDDK